jgi:hypothetical protein
MALVSVIFAPSKRVVKLEHHESKNDKGDDPCPPEHPSHRTYRPDTRALSCIP